MKSKTLFGRLAKITDYLKADHSNLQSWSLQRIRSRVSEAIDNPIGELSYEIADDLLAPMRALWREWVTKFESDPETLHHFFGLMLCTMSILYICIDNRHYYLGEYVAISRANEKEANNINYREYFVYR